MIENKLQNFRNEQKAKEKREAKNQFLNKIFNYLIKPTHDFIFNSAATNNIKTKNVENNNSKLIKTKTDLKKEKLERIQKVLKETSTPSTKYNDNEDESEEEEEEEIVEDKNVKYLNIFLKFLLWLIIFIIFIKLEFGLVFFIISMIIAIYLNTSSNSRKLKTKNNLSAYSVFNPNLERIGGTFSSEHVEKSIRNML